MMATAAATVMPAAVAGFAGRGSTGGTGRSEGGKFLRELLRAAMRAFGIFPVGRADEDLAVAIAGFAMEFVDWHEGNYSVAEKIQARGLCLWAEGR